MERTEIFMKSFPELIEVMIMSFRQLCSGTGGKFDGEGGSFVSIDKVGFDDGASFS